MLSSSDALVLIGAGKMGGAMLSGWLAGRLQGAQVHLRDPNPPAEMAKLVATQGLKLNFSIEDIAAEAPRVVVLAVKPQIMDAVLPELKPLVRPGTLFLSIAAGVGLDRIEAGLGSGAAIVRTMPNTPASVGKGITAAIGNAHITPEDRALCDELLSAIGAVVWLRQEAEMDAVTALSGSGPAYVFALAETMAAAGEQLGLDPVLAKKLARATVAGAGAMLDVLPEDVSDLRRNVTSPGGTTAAALDVLLGDEGLWQLMRNAMNAARARSRELSK
ncbi:MAG: pyrroline-5-carboxylate reductase [Parvibaculum sp.]